MSRPQRNLLVAALTLVAAGLMGLGLGLFGDGTHGTQSVERDPRAVPGTGTNGREPAAAGLQATTGQPRADAGATAHASLEVRVIDPRGAPLPEATMRATMRATSPASGDALEARGRVRWTELEPGTWQLEVAHADYPTHRTGVLLEADKSLRHIVQLDTQLPLRGRVIDGPSTRCVRRSLPTPCARSSNDDPAEAPASAGPRAREL